MGQDRREGVKRELKNKKVLLPVLGIAFLGSTIFGASLVSAQDSTTTTPSIVQRIAEKFNLNQTDVQAVFDEERSERHAKMQEQLEQKLSQAVADGKINETQKQAILDKFGEIKEVKFKNFEEVKSMTDEERHQAMETKKSELESWAEQNDIDLDTLHELMGHKGGMKFMHRID